MPLCIEKSRKEWDCNLEKEKEEAKDERRRRRIKEFKNSSQDRRKLKMATKD